MEVSGSARQDAVGWPGTGCWDEAAFRITPSCPIPDADPPVLPGMDKFPLRDNRCWCKWRAGAHWESRGWAGTAW